MRSHAHNTRSHTRVVACGKEEAQAGCRGEGARGGVRARRHDAPPHAWPPRPAPPQVCPCPPAKGAAVVGVRRVHGRGGGLQGGRVGGQGPPPHTALAEGASSPYLAEGGASGAPLFCPTQSPASRPQEVPLQAVAARCDGGAQAGGALAPPQCQWLPTDTPCERHGPKGGPGAQGPARPCMNET